jgi:N-acetylneuraminic acid mutarotase
MKKHIIYIFFLLIIILFSTCDKDFITTEFPGVVTLSVDQTIPDQVTFTGEIISRNTDNIDEMGFIWQREDDPAGYPDYRIVANSITKNGNFSMTVKAFLKKDVQYYVRAYAKVGDYTLYGDSLGFKCRNDINAPLLNLYPVTGSAGDTVLISGEIFNASYYKNTILFDGHVSTIVEVSDSVIRCIVPLELTAKESTVILLVEGLSTALTQSFTLTTPTITSFTPDVIHFLDTLVITGTGFNRITRLNKVTIGNEPAQIISSTQTTLSVIIPFTEDSLCFISVEVSGQSTTSSDKLKIIEPVIDYFYPVSGTYLDTIFIHFRNLDPAQVTSVYFDNFQANIVSSIDSIMGIEVPIDLNKEFSDVKITFLSIEYVFNYKFHLNPPEITGISNATCLNQEIITLSGNNFNPTASLNKIIFTNEENGNTYILYPLSAWKDSMKVRIYNHQKPGYSLPSSTYQIGIQTCETAYMSDKTLSITDMWRRLDDFPGGARYKGAAFAINGKGYSGLGTKISNNVQKDLWEFEPVNEVWTQKANFPGNPRIYPCVFISDNESYVGAGQSLDNGNLAVPYTDLYKYNPSSNSWKQMANAPYVEKAYAGSSASPGYNIFVANLSLSVLSEYNPENDTWSVTYDKPEFANSGSLTFSLNGKTYFVMGYHVPQNTGTINQVWEYDPATNNMILKNDFTGPSRCNGFGFAINQFGYIGCGRHTDNESDTYLSDVYRYDPQNDSWTQIESFPGGNRSCQVSFVIGNKAYILTGFNTSSLTKDVWEFYDPDNH